MQGFDVATRPTNLLVALFGAFVGTVVGLLPGLGPINGVALLLPLAFALGLPPETALILLAAVYLGCEYGGRISAILLNVPGDAAAVMTPSTATRWRARARRASRCRCRGQLLYRQHHRHLRGGAVRRCWPSGRWPSARRVLRANDLRHRLSRRHGRRQAGEDADGRADGPGPGHRRCRFHYRRLPLHTFGSVSLSDGIQFVIVVIGFFSVSEILLMLERPTAGRRRSRPVAGCCSTSRSSA